MLFSRPFRSSGSSAMTVFGSVLATFFFRSFARPRFVIPRHHVTALEVWMAARRLRRGRHDARIVRVPLARPGVGGTRSTSAFGPRLVAVMPDPDLAAMGRR